MLILSRKCGETIHFYKGGKRIGTIILCNIQGMQAKLGFEFDEELDIVRSELVEHDEPKSRRKAGYNKV